MAFAVRHHDPLAVFLLYSRCPLVSLLLPRFTSSRGSLTPCAEEERERERESGKIGEHRRRTTPLGRSLCSAISHLVSETLLSRLWPLLSSATVMRRADRRRADPTGSTRCGFAVGRGTAPYEHFSSILNRRSRDIGDLVFGDSVGRCSEYSKGGIKLLG